MWKTQNTSDIVRLGILKGAVLWYNNLTPLAEAELPTAERTLNRTGRRKEDELQPKNGRPEDLVRLNNLTLWAKRYL